MELAGSSRIAKRMNGEAQKNRREAAGATAGQDRQAADRLPSTHPGEALCGVDLGRDRERLADVERTLGKSGREDGRAFPRRKVAALESVALVRPARGAG